MRKQLTVTEEKIIAVKAALSRGLSLRNCAMRATVSYYTAWHISKGTYDTKEPLLTAFPKDNSLFSHNDKMFI